MRIVSILTALAVVAASSVPVFAAEAMNSMSMMEGGQVVSIMPDGHMGTMMMTDAAMMDNMMKMAKPLDQCVMFITGKDGKTYMVTLTTKEEIAECEKMAM